MKTVLHVMLVVALVLLMASPVLARGGRRCYKHDEPDCICSSGYDDDFKLMVGPEVSLLHPNWRRANLIGNYLNFDDVTAAYHINGLDPAAFEDQEGRITFHFSIWDEDDADPAEQVRNRYFPGTQPVE
jgi:hypothetical protein